MADPVLLVLGGGQYQLPSIAAAQSMKLKVAVCDRSSSVPGARFADVFEAIDTTDRDAVTAFARRIGAVGILAPCTDVALPTQAFAAAALGLPGPPLASVERLVDKISFRQLLSAMGLPAPEWHTFDPAGAVTLPRGNRAIVKPARSSGSKGIRIVDASNAAAAAVEAASYSTDGRAILEAFVEGRQGSVEGFMIDGEPILALVTDRLTADPPFVATKGHIVPAQLTASVRRELIGQIMAVFRHLGISQGPFDCDFVVSGERVYLLEMTPRMGGNSLTKLVAVATGIDLARAAVLASLRPGLRPHFGTLPAFVEDERPAAVVIFGCGIAGRLSYDEEAYRRIAKESGVVELSIDVPQGADVRPFVDGRARIGEAVVTGTTRHDVEALCSRIERELEFEARPCPI